MKKKIKSVDITHHFKALDGVREEEPHMLEEFVCQYFMAAFQTAVEGNKLTYWFEFELDGVDQSTVISNSFKDYVSLIGLSKKEIKKSYDILFNGK